MKVLIAVASKYGASAEIGGDIARVLTDRGHVVMRTTPEEVDSLDGYDAAIVGSAVYAGHWMEPARDLIDRVGGSLTERPVWLFSSGPIGDPPRPEEDPVDVADIVRITKARDHRVFAGKLGRKQLSFAERAMVVAFRAPDGDFRDRNEIRVWASQIADALTAGP
jgi:menaquinone-dependent protoporphyrinogen oxidase